MDQSKYQSGATLSERQKLLENADMRRRLQAMYYVEGEADKRFQDLLGLLDEACASPPEMPVRPSPERNQVRQ
jgi:hypothetical protein